MDDESNCILLSAAYSIILPKTEPSEMMEDRGFEEGAESTADAYVSLRFFGGGGGAFFFFSDALLSPSLVTAGGGGSEGGVVATESSVSSNVGSAGGWEILGVPAALRLVMVGMGGTAGADEVDDDGMEDVAAAYESFRLALGGACALLLDFLLCLLPEPKCSV